jgi:hypothetical protein
MSNIDSKYIIGSVVIILLLCMMLSNTNEGFDAKVDNVSKLNSYAIANKYLKEFDYDKFKPYIDKYFKPNLKIGDGEFAVTGANNSIVKDLTKIPVLANGLIMCSVASYRDKQCLSTVKELIDKAKHPHNLVIVVCIQNHPEEDETCMDRLDKKGAVLKYIDLDFKQAKGPCWARYLIQQEWSGEEYFLQIDSHTRFVDDWDTKCIDQLKMLPNKSVLSNYVSEFNLETGEKDKNPLRAGLFVEHNNGNDVDGFFRINSPYVPVGVPKSPMCNKGWSACFSFSKSDILHDGPYDAFTPFLFFGEEMDIYARLYTRGWHSYAPSVPICFTNFNRSYRKTFWENPEESIVGALSRLRLYYKFKFVDDIHPSLKVDMDKYALGTVRSLEDFLKWSVN